MLYCVCLVYDRGLCVLAICVLIACLTRKHGVDAEMGVVLLSLMRIEIVCRNSLIAG